ncbi:MAG: HEPN domain-containing protein [Syntrophaceae bacterium]|nr:HEPN domain-containing protein [Syntrophaceae bacterium]
MNNKTELQRWKRDAQDYFKEAQRAFSENSFRSATQNSQLCIESACKAIISYFGEPEWTHSPGKQLIKIIEDKKADLEKSLPAGLIKALYRLSDDADFAGPWHGLATYGEARGGVHYAAVDICTKEVAEDLYKRARNAYMTLENFCRYI